MFDRLRHELSARQPRRADPEGRTPAAVALPLVISEGEPEILLIKREERFRDPWSGQMALPGGRMEAGDPDLMATAMRETREETGIELKEDGLLGILDDLSPMTPHLPPIYVRPFVFGLEERPRAQALEEVELALWVPVAEMTRSRVREEIEVRGFRLVVDGYRLGPHLVWGMTERILTPLLDMLGRVTGEP